MNTFLILLLHNPHTSPKRATASLFYIIFILLTFAKYTLYDGPDALITNKLSQLGGHRLCSVTINRYIYPRRRSTVYKVCAVILRKKKRYSSSSLYTGGI